MESGKPSPDHTKVMVVKQRMKPTRWEQSGLMAATIGAFVVQERKFCVRFVERIFPSCNKYKNVTMI